MSVPRDEAESRRSTATSAVRPPSVRIRRDWYSVSDARGNPLFQLREGREFRDHLGYSYMDHPEASEVYVETPLPAEQDAERRSERAFLEHIRTAWQEKEWSESDRRAWFERDGGEPVVHVVRRSETVPGDSERLIFREPEHQRVLDPHIRREGTLEDDSYIHLMRTEPSYTEEFVLAGDPYALSPDEDGVHPAYRPRAEDADYRRAHGV